jgi:hypothetical protein
VKLPKFRLFILGSGFSHAAGLPLGPELLDEVREQIRREYQRHNWEGPLEKEIKEWQQLYPSEQLNLESVLAYSHRKHFLRLSGSDEYFDHGSRSIVAARFAIQEILTRRTPSAIPPLYREFASQLTPFDTVMTFNYDTLLEQALEEQEKPFSLTPEWWLSQDEEPATERYVNLIKLHGSIDWYDRYYYDKNRAYYATLNNEVADNDPLFGPARTIPTESLARESVADGCGVNLLPRVYRVPNHKNHFPFAAPHSVVPFLLAPAYDKLLGSDPIRDLWENMHRTMDSFSMISVIGYSMPNYDGYAYEALGRLICKYQGGGNHNAFNQRRVPLQVITKSSSETKVIQSIPFLQPANTKIWTEGFSQESLNWMDWG